MMRAFKFSPSRLLTLTRPYSTSALSKPVQAASGSAKNRLWLGTTCLVGCALFGLAKLQNNESASGDTESSNSSGWGEWKNSVMTNYENRIRSFSSPEKVFSVFASVSKNGHNYMTVDDFIRALIPYEHSALLAQKHPNNKRKYKTLPAAFKMADQNQDGLISFEEYLFFVTLLSIPEQSFKVAFRMLDVNDDGTVDQNEFMKMMSFLRAASPHTQQTRSTSAGIAQGWLTHYFGDNASKLTLDTFTKFLEQLRSDVLRLEFNLYDPQEQGYISQRDFGMLLVSYARTQNLPAYVKRAETLETTPLKLFTFEQFQSFNKLLEHLPEVETAMQLYQLNGRPFRKQDLSHLSKIVCGTNLNQQVIDTMMSIFDSNNDGTLDLDEFVTVLKRRKARGLSEPRDTGFLRRLEKIVKCVREA